MSAGNMIGEQHRGAFDQAIHKRQPPISENERRAMAAQIYPALLPAMKPCEDGKGRSGEKATSHGPFLSHQLEKA